MPDSLTSAGRRPVDTVRAVELEGQSPAITRVHELLRRAAAGGKASCSSQSTASTWHRSLSSCTLAADSRTPRSSVSTVRENARGWTSSCSARRRPASSTWNPSRRTAGSRRREVERCFSRTWASFRLPSRPDWRDWSAMARRRSMGSRSRCRSASSGARRRESGPTWKPVASVWISIAACAAPASICRRCDIGPKTCRPWRFAFSRI